MPDQEMPTATNTDHSPADFRFHGDPSKLFEAIAKARASFSPVHKDRAGQTGHQHFQYAPLANLVEASVPALSAQGVVTMQFITTPANIGLRHRLTTIVAGHGARIESHIDFTPAVRRDGGDDIKEYGKQTTYLRRYAYNALFILDGVEDADDDAETTRGGVAPQQRPQQQAKPAPQKQREAPAPSQPQRAQEQPKAAPQQPAQQARPSERPPAQAPAQAAPSQPPTGEPTDDAKRRDRAGARVAIAFNRLGVAQPARPGIAREIIGDGFDARHPTVAQLEAIGDELVRRLMETGGEHSITQEQLDQQVAKTREAQAQRAAQQQQGAR